jgi:DNA polymerase-3 subunit epsilon
VRSSLERKLVVGILVLFLIPTVVAGGVLSALYWSGVFESPAALALAVITGFVTMMAYLGGVAYGIGRTLVRRLQEIRLGTELMAGVNPDHRLTAHGGDEIEALAEEINRMADRLRDGRVGLQAEVARATWLLDVERGKLSAVLESLGEGVALATPEGRVILANPAAHELLGAGPVTLLGRSLYDVLDREAITYHLERLRHGAGRVERFGLRVGGDTVLQAVMTAFPGEAGPVTGFVLVLRDVTRPARFDDERRQRLGDTVRDLRGPLASIRSLSESLVHDAAAAPVKRLVEAIHAEAVRLSGVVTGASHEGLDAAASAVHFEELSVADVCAMALRRLPPGRRSRVEVAGSAMDVFRAEAATLSAGLAHLLEALLARGGPGAGAWLQARHQSGVLHFEAGARGGASISELEAALDVPVALGVGCAPSVRAIARAHAGEVWGYSVGDRHGFRLTMPTAATPAGPAPAGPAFAGAGLVSGAAPEATAASRPDFYDFSLFQAMERHVSPEDRDQPLQDLPCVVFDTETTGLAPESGDRVVSIAAVRVRAGAVRRGETFDALVNPGRLIPPPSVKFHGITDEMVAGAPVIDVVLPAFLRFADGAVLIGHQVWFDLRFLTIAAARLGLPPPSRAHAVLDTLLLSEVVHGRLEGHGLDVVAQRLGVEVRGRHSALGDALTTAEVFVRLLPLLTKRGIRTLGQALAATRRAARVGSPAP